MGHKEFGNLLIRECTIAVNNPVAGVDYEDKINNISI
jgi:hypothetical protein